MDAKLLQTPDSYPIFVAARSFALTISHEFKLLAFENAPDQAFLGRPLDREFLEPAFLGHRHARFQSLGIDDDFLVDFLHRLDHPLDFFDQR